jgi:organic hydroperoxide reductase OsmC/OhrA
MSEHSASILWERREEGFLAGKYSREHSWHFDGGAVVAASAAPSNVPAPFSNPANVDPEEAYVASLSSCHMLWFLYLASRGGFQLDRYEDRAVGKMSQNEQGKLWISEVSLRPRIEWSGTQAPSPEEVEGLHHAAHEQCFIASSVKTEIRVEPQ